MNTTDSSCRWSPSWSNSNWSSNDAGRQSSSRGPPRENQNNKIQSSRGMYHSFNNALIGNERDPRIQLPHQYVGGEHLKVWQTLPSPKEVDWYQQLKEEATIPKKATSTQIHRHGGRIADWLCCREPSQLCEADPPTISCRTCSITHRRG